MIVTISGFIGSGKTTVAKDLSMRLCIKHVSAGEIFRDMAKKNNLSLEDFTKMAEINPKIDQELDNQLQDISKEEESIIDGRLSGWLVDAELKIWLKAPLNIRINRVARREKKDYEHALKETKMREESEIRRYKELYNIDMNDLTPYNVVIDTAKWRAEEVVDLIYDLYLTINRRC
jgi:cytidylate kinase